MWKPKHARDKDQTIKVILVSSYYDGIMEFVGEISGSRYGLILGTCRSETSQYRSFNVYSYGNGHIEKIGTVKESELDTEGAIM